jgi:hypothetical protein
VSFPGLSCGVPTGLHFGGARFPALPCRAFLWRPLGTFRAVFLGDFFREWLSWWSGFKGEDCEWLAGRTQGLKPALF